MFISRTGDIAPFLLTGVAVKVFTIIWWPKSLFEIWKIENHSIVANENRLIDTQKIKFKKKIVFAIRTTIFFINPGALIKPVEIFQVFDK